MLLASWNINSIRARTDRLLRWLYSWWDYRKLSFPRNDGLRLDLVLATPSVARKCTSASIDGNERKGLQPSDHAPVLATFDLP